MNNYQHSNFSLKWMWLLCSQFVFFAAHAQNHYWNQQFGAANTLTGGAEIAGVRDNTALFYNPGAMGFITTNKISLSANIYEAEIVKLKNVAGKGQDAQSFRVLLYPQFIGGSFFVKKVPKLKIIYGTLMRNRSSLRYNFQYENTLDVIKGSPGDEYYKARLEYEFSSLETWAGVGLAYKFNKYISAGASFFGSYTNLETLTSLSLSTDGIYNSVPYTASVSQYGSLKIDHVNFICKLGVAAEFKAFKMGLSITLPSAKIFGQGTLTKSFEGHNLNIYSQDTVSPFLKYPSFLVSDEQNKLSTQYKTPASFALGAEYKTSKVKIKFATEFFLGLPTYDVIKGKDESFLRPASAYGGKTIKDFMLVRSGARPVLNGSIGGSFRFKDKFKLLTGFRTDFNNRMNFSPSLNYSPTKDVGLGSLNPTYYHLLHFSLGVSYNRGANDVTVGVNYALGIAAERRSTINVTDPTQQQLLRGTTEKIMRTNVNNIGLIIGYTYFFRGSLRGSEDSNKQPMTDW